MSVRVYLEIGHEASLRTKRTPEGFTHDWEVYVRGINGAEIQYFVEKVVFHLHETFPKPKRVVKEAPYVVKESGYAGFNLPIDIYLRNAQDPKKVRVNYDLQLQPSGPAIRNVQKEKFVFDVPDNDFKERLLKGGGKLVNTSQEGPECRVTDEKSHSSKSKYIANDCLKKSKFRNDDSNTSFQDLFGTPITTTRVHSENSMTSIKENKNFKAHSMGSEKYNVSKDKTKDTISSNKSLGADKTTKDHSKEFHKEGIKNPNLTSQKKSTGLKQKSDTSDGNFGEKRDSRYDKDEWNKRSKKDKSSTSSQKDIDRTKNKHYDKSHGLDKSTAKEHTNKQSKNKDTISSTSHKGMDYNETENKPKLPKLMEKKSIDPEKGSDKYIKKEHKSHKKGEKSAPSKRVDNLALLSETNELDSCVKRKHNAITGSYISTNEKNKSEKTNSSDSEQDCCSVVEESMSHRESQSRVGANGNDGFSNVNTKYKNKKNKGKTRRKHSDSDLEKLCLKSGYDDVETSVSDTQFEEYMSALKDLQQRIMTITNNNDLQQIVKVIADTGRFEISASTFDFDLCTLDRSTIRQLQEMLVTES